MTDPLDIVANTAAELATSEATTTELRRKRDRAIYSALDTNQYQSLIADRAGVSPQYVSKLANHRDKYEPRDPDDSEGASDWVRWYAEWVDEEAPLEDWHRHSKPFSPLELREILDQVTNIRLDDKAWAEAQREDAAQHQPARPTRP